MNQWEMRYSKNRKEPKWQTNVLTKNLNYKKHPLTYGLQQIMKFTKFIVYFSFRLKV